MNGLTHTFETGVQGERLIVFKINGAHYVTYSVSEKGWSQVDLTCNWQIQPTHAMEMEIRRICNEQIAILRDKAAKHAEPALRLNVDAATLLLARQEVSDRIRELTHEDVDGRNRARLSDLGAVLTQINGQLADLRRSSLDQVVEAIRVAQAVARFANRAGA